MSTMILVFYLACVTSLCVEVATNTPFVAVVFRHK